MAGEFVFLLSVLLGFFGLAVLVSDVKFIL